MSATPPPAINCFMPWDLAPGVIVAVALQQVDGSPDAETDTESYYEGLQYSDCAVEKCHKCVPPCFLRPEHEKTLKTRHFWHIFNVLQPLFATRFERATFRLGVWLTTSYTVA